MRNPLDVAVSLAFHSAIDLDAAIAQMADADRAFSVATTKLPPQLRQRLSSWSRHVESWIDAPGIGRCIVRYEDMVERPLDTFAQAARFLGLTAPDDRLRDALDKASFERLRDEEARDGFVEKPYRMERYFREDASGDGASIETPCKHSASSTIIATSCGASTISIATAQHVTEGDWRVPDFAISETSIVSRAPDVIATELDGEAVLMSIARGQCYGFERSARASGR